MQEPVLRADVVALTVELGRIVDREEHLEEGFVRNHGWVKLDFHHLGMPVVPLQNGVVGRDGGRGRLRKRAAPILRREFVCRRPQHTKSIRHRQSFVP